MAQMSRTGSTFKDVTASWRMAPICTSVVVAFWQLAERTSGHECLMVPYRNCRLLRDEGLLLFPKP